MKYILATDSFKGCMSSAEVENIIAEVLNAKGIETVCLPMSDGGAATDCFGLSHQPRAEHWSLCTYTT